MMIGTFINTIIVLPSMLILRFIRAWILQLLSKLGIFLPLNEDQPQWSDVCDLLRTWIDYTRVGKPVIQWFIVVLQFFNVRSFKLGRAVDNFLHEMIIPPPAFFSAVKTEFLQLGFTNETIDELIAFLKNGQDICNGDPLLLVSFLDNFDDDLGVLESVRESIDFIFLFSYSLNHILDFQNSFWLRGKKNSHRRSARTGNWVYSRSRPLREHQPKWHSVSVYLSRPS
jgi:hypothetical protein